MLAKRRRDCKGLAALAVAVLALISDVALGDDELDRFIAEQTRLIEDARRPIADRERSVRNLAATLDRAAQSAESEPSRRERWAQAVALLDRFNRDQPGHAESDVFAVQSAVFDWAQARSWMRQAETEPGDGPNRRAAASLDAAIARLGPMVASGTGRGDLTIQNARFRLAQALEDRAGLEPRGSEAAKKERETAIEALGPGPIGEPTLAGPSELLRSRLLAGLGRFDDAQAAIDAASKADPPPPGDELRDARLDAALGRGKFDDAWTLVRSSGADDATRELLAVRVRLAEAARGPESGRSEALADAFRRAGLLRKTDPTRARSALLALDRALPDPGADLGPESLDTLAEGRLLAGDPAGAARLVDLASDRARGLGHREQAASLRFRAGAIRFRSGDDLGAEAAFSGVVADPSAGADRARAGLLRALARGRLVAASRPGATEESYAQALVDQIRDFPADPTADEARWLLGLVRRASGAADEAAALWRSIPRGHPRGLDARLALAEIREQEVEAHRLDPEPAEGRRLAEEARAQLSRLLTETTEPSQAAEVELARARLELVPGFGHADAAQIALDRALSHPHAADLDGRARRLRVVALALAGRYLDAEQVARVEAAESRPLECLALARDLDRAASASDSDVQRRRIGGILRLVLQPVLARGDQLTPSGRAEARLRDLRARYFRGDHAAAKDALVNDPALDPATIDPALLVDLADLNDLLDRPAAAISAYRRLASLVRAGSPPWFEARLGQAAALARSGKPAAALRLVEATRILHPDLGGATTRARFEKVEKMAGKQGGNGR